MADPLTQTPNIHNDGSKLVLQKNLILAEMSHPGGENYPLLITKEVFRVEKVPPEDRLDPKGPFEWPAINQSNPQKSLIFSGDLIGLSESKQNDYESIVKHSGFLTRIPKFQWIQQ